MKRLHFESVFVGANSTAFLANLLLGTINADPLSLSIAALNAFAAVMLWDLAGRAV